MAPSSIQVSEETRKALARYKIEGMTYDQVLRLLMDVVDPDELHAVYRAWQRKLVGEIRKSKKWKELKP